MNHFTLYPTKAEAIATSSLYPPLVWIPKNLSDEEIDLIKKYESKSLDDPNYWGREERPLEDLSLDDLFLEDLSSEEEPLCQFKN